MQVFLALADQFVGRGSGNQMGEAFEGDGVAVVYETLDCFAESEELGHGFSRLVIQGIRRCRWENLIPRPGSEQSDNRLFVRISNTSGEL
ncbi:hypothetical protein D9M72_601630 [compost metagenome]